MTRVAWVRLGSKEPLFWKWLALRTALTALPALICFRLGAGLLGLGAFALGALVGSTAIGIDANGVVLRCLGVAERWSKASIERVRIEDASAGKWFRRRTLRIERRGGSVVQVFGREGVLLELEAAAARGGFAVRGSESLQDP